jgi:MoxR-like ATPase
MGGRCTRVQFTPDLMPSDITGTSVFDPRDASFRFRPGPVFTHVLIADEINRASPRTQSALLEALSEGQVTSDGKTRALEQPFICVATQNQVELHGTFPLPEASLDRFAIRVSLGYATEDEELAILTDQRTGHPLDELGAVTSAEGIARLRRAVDEVHIEQTVARYLLRLVRRSREHAAVRLGVSTRGALTLSRLARARALHRGRDYVLPDDVQALAAPVLAHRLMLDGRARHGVVDPSEVVADIVRATPLPR